MQRVRQSISTAILSALVVAACGGTADTTTTPETSDSTAGPMTTGVPQASSATTATTTTTTTSATTTTTTTPASTNELASGSGCTPGTDELADGRWFGFVTEASGATLGFDLACWFSGEAATLAASEDGEESPPPNDYHIRNVNARVRTVPVLDGAQVIWMPNPGDPVTAQTIPYAAWVVDRGSRPFQPGIWIEVAGGSVRSVEEQYVP